MNSSQIWMEVGIGILGVVVAIAIVGLFIMLLVHSALKAPTYTPKHRDEK
jgi:uncharacterized protein (UPF0333 family)